MTETQLFSVDETGLVVHEDNIYKMSRSYLIRYRTRLIDFRSLLEATNALRGHVMVDIHVQSPELQIFATRPYLIGEAIGVLNEHIKLRYEREWGEL